MSKLRQIDMELTTGSRQGVKSIQVNGTSNLFDDTTKTELGESVPKRLREEKLADCVRTDSSSAQPRRHTC